MRSLVPAETLVYLETNDLGAALQPIIENPVFEKATASKPDLSALKGIQLAVAVSGFEMSEEKLTDEHSIARVQPRFVAIADTHAWNWQAVAFAENNIGAFVMEAYRGDVSQERTAKHGGTWFVWTANDGRKAFALVSGSVIFFGNDESAIDKSVAVMRGEGPNLAGNTRIPAADQRNIAVGYAAPDGVAQIANLAALSLASQTDGEPEVQRAVADIIPQLLRGAVTEVVWTAVRTETGFEDRYSITSPESVANVFADTLQPAKEADTSIFRFIPADVPTVTSYNLQKPHVAWRSVLLTAQSLSDPLAGRIIAEFSNAFTEPYGIRDAELFLSGVDSRILTGNLDPGGDKPFVAAKVLILENVRRSLDVELKPDTSRGETRAEIWRSADGELAATFYEGFVVVGNAESVSSCLKARSGPTNAALVGRLSTDAAATTLAVDRETAPAIASVISERKSGDAPSTYSSETRFTRTGIERRTTSDFGLIGWIIAQLSEN